MKFFYARCWISKYLRYHPNGADGPYISNSLDRAIVRLSHRVYRGHGLRGHNIRQAIRKRLRSKARSVNARGG